MKLEFIFIFQLFLFFFSLRESRSQDFMNPTLNVVDELQKIRTMEGQMNRLQKENEDLLKVVETLRSNSANTNSRIDELLPKIQESADKSVITSIQSELQNLKSKLAIVEKVTADKSVITSIQSELQNLKSKVDIVEKDKSVITSMQSELQNLKSRLGIVENASADKSLVTSIQSELQNVKSRIAIMEKVSDFHFFKKVGQKYYVANGQTATFGNALTFCQSQGAALALPQNQAENLVLATMHGLLGAEYVYLGTTDRENEGKFVDMNKKPLVYANWRKNEPNNHKGGEDCVGIRSDAQWNDLPCGHACHVVCEF